MAKHFGTNLRDRSWRRAQRERAIRAQFTFLKNKMWISAPSPIMPKRGYNTTIWRDSEYGLQRTRHDWEMVFRQRQMLALKRHSYNGSWSRQINRSWSKRSQQRDYVRELEDRASHLLMLDELS